MGGGGHGGETKFGEGSGDNLRFPAGPELSPGSGTRGQRHPEAGNFSVLLKLFWPQL